jgi:hypothetical protein
MLCLQAPTIRNSRFADVGITDRAQLLRPKQGRRSRFNRLQRKWILPPRDRPWVRIFIDDVASEAWRHRSINARRVLYALICQHFHYYQKENGKLHIPYRLFERFGVTKCLISSAIKELIDVGMITTKAGARPNDVLRPRTLYELTIYPKKDSEDFQKDDRTRRQFFWVPIDVLESPEWRLLSINELRILERLLIENIHHGSERNGQLCVSYGQFVEFGIGRRFIAPAIRQLIEVGFLAMSTSVRQGSQRAPNLYRLTFLGTLDGPATWEKRDSSDNEPLHETAAQAIMETQNCKRKNISHL